MKAVILGAGKGKRLLSEQHNMPKVMRRANGKALIEYVLENLSFVDEEDIVIVVGYKKETIIDNISGNYVFVTQEEQLGTGHAVNCAGEALKDYDGEVLVCYGDMPLFKQETYESLVNEHNKQKADCTVLTAQVDEHLPYGRIIRKDGEFYDVVEQKDTTPEQDKIREYNVGIYVFDSKKLFSYLSRLRNNNAQGEYYLTDIPKLMLEDGLTVKTTSISNSEEIMGVNTPEDLEAVEKILKKRVQ